MDNDEEMNDQNSYHYSDDDQNSYHYSDNEEMDTTNNNTIVTNNNNSSNTKNQSSTSSTKCRFCGREGQGNVCVKRECLEKESKFCRLQHEACQHYCLGIHQESIMEGESCLPCLYCNHGTLPKQVLPNTKIVLPNPTDMCIFAEEYEALPCILLDCGHVEHYQCIIEQLQSKWSGNRITFNFLNCSLCRLPLNHWSLIEILDPLKELKKQVELMAFKRIAIEGLWPPKKLSNNNNNSYSSSSSSSSSTPSTTWYTASMIDYPNLITLQNHPHKHDILAEINQRIDYAMEELAYYQCQQCHLPFFGGLNECEASSNDNNNKKELVSPTKTSSSSTIVVGKSNHTYNHDGGTRLTPINNNTIISSPQKTTTLPSPLISNNSSSSSSSISTVTSSSATTEVYLCPTCVAPLPGNPKTTVCKKHGEENLIHKCKWCCSIATHFCRGLNRYCDRCHDMADENARKNGTIMNWEPILQNDRTRDCDGKGTTCPLGVPHPPHGTEYCLGCGMCKLEAESMKDM